MIDKQVGKLATIIQPTDSRLDRVLGKLGLVRRKRVLFVGVVIQIEKQINQPVYVTMADPSYFFQHKREPGYTVDTP